MDSSRRINIDSDYSVFTAHILPAHIFITIMGELFFFFSFAGSILYLFMERQLRKKSSMKFIYRLPNLETIENFINWAISRSLILISIGIIIGVIIAKTTIKLLEPYRNSLLNNTPIRLILIEISSSIQKYLPRILLK